MYQDVLEISSILELVVPQVGQDAFGCFVAGTDYIFDAVLACHSMECPGNRHIRWCFGLDDRGFQKGKLDVSEFFPIKDIALIVEVGGTRDIQDVPGSLGENSALSIWTRSVLTPNAFSFSARNDCPRLRLC